MTWFTVVTCSVTEAPQYLSFITASVSVGLILITVPPNLLICWAFYKDPYNVLRTPFNFLVVNLAVTDILIGLVVEPISAVFHFQEGLAREHLDDTLIVAVLLVVYFVSFTVSVLSISALSIDRYIAVAHPLYYRNYNHQLRRRRPVLASVIIWCVSTALSSAYFKVGYINFIFVLANTSIIIASGILLFSYFSILREIRPEITPSNTVQIAAVRHNQREKRITKSFLLILTFYLLCGAPSCVLIYLINFCTSCSCDSIHWFRDMQFVLVLLNSALNPYLYSWRIPKFRKAIKFILGLQSTPNNVSYIAHAAEVCPTS